MAMIRQDVTKWLQDATPGSLFDSSLLRAGFIRLCSSPTYERQSADFCQRMKVVFDVGPRYEPNAIAHVLPQVVMESEVLGSLVLKMVPQGPLHNPETAALVLRVQLQNLIPRGPAHGQASRWFLYGASDVPRLLDEIGRFADAYALPFLDRYREARSLILGYEGGDERLRLDRRFYLYVAAAYLSVGQPENAMRLMEDMFGRAAQRKQYATAFEYVRNWQQV